MATTQLTQSAARCTTNPTLSGARTALVHALSPNAWADPGTVKSGEPPHTPQRVLSVVSPCSTPPSIYHVTVSRSGCCTVQPAVSDTVIIGAGHRGHCPLRAMSSSPALRNGFYGRFGVPQKSRYWFSKHVSQAFPRHLEACIAELSCAARMVKVPALGLAPSIMCPG